MMHSRDAAGWGRAARALLGAVLLAPVVLARAQDLATLAVAAPAAGSHCGLGAAEAVTIRLFNYGVALPAGTMFNVGYALNAGPPVTELVVLGSTLPMDSTFTYSFVTPANLSVPGNYVIDASVSLPGDVNPSNDAYTGHAVGNDAPSVGGSVSAPAAPASAGTLTLGGHTGDVLQWEESPDGQRWFALANTTPTQAFAGLRVPTQFRARVRSGSCPEAVSGSVTVTP